MDPIDTFARYLSCCFGTDVPHVRLGEASVPDLAIVSTHDPSALRSLDLEFRGTAPGREAVGVVSPWSGVRPAPAGFRVTAFVPTFNEADIIASTVAALIEDGVGVYVIDNWSTDQTYDIVQGFYGRGLLGCERFPADGPSETYNLRQILRRVETLAASQNADWFVLHDADERRRPPWPRSSLRDALYEVEQRGFNCVDHVTLNFWPVDDSYIAGSDPEAHFRYFEFSRHPGHFHQRRAWRNLGQRVQLAATAGHDVTFGGRRVFPYKFLLKHYPVRSRAHGERKVLRERRARWNAEERAVGWHAQYDELTPARFVRDPSELERFDASFYERRLIERLSGVGIVETPPEWATPPHWAISVHASSAA